MKRIPIAAALMLGVFSGAFAQTPAPNDKAISQVNGIFWTQQSVEHRAASIAAYNAATAALPGLLRGKAWASLERGAARGKRAAVVLDIDETVLDNSAYNAWTVRNNLEFAPKTWAAWIALEAADEVPGAAAFTRAAAKLGVDVFYVTNRDCAPSEDDPCPALTHTQANMQRLGFARAGDRDAFMLKKQRPEWSESDKTSRREKIAETHRIVMMFGDDMNDFLPAANLQHLRRGEPDAAAEAMLAKFGKSLFMIPNPGYGSWERGLAADPAGRIPALKTPEAWKNGA